MQNHERGGIIVCRKVIVTIATNMADGGHRFGGNPSNEEDAKNQRLGRFV
jgi:hypothetical protein